MTSYAITGASRGLGLEFLRNLSSNPSNTVIGLVRNVAETETRIAAWKTPNIHIIEGDLNNYDSLKKAAATTSSITSGSLDVIIANAAYMPDWSALEPFSVLGRDPSHLTKDLIDTFTSNVVGNIHLFNLFMPLILKGSVKKVITLSSGMGDAELTSKYNLHEGGPYAITKAAVNMAVAKFQAEYEKDGVLFMAICPGTVNTGQYDNLPEEDVPKLMAMGEKFIKYAPHYTGQASPEEAVKDVLNVIQKSSLENGAGGSYVSHFGTKQWL